MYYKNYQSESKRLSDEELDVKLKETNEKTTRSINDRYLYIVNFDHSNNKNDRMSHFESMSLKMGRFILVKFKVLRLSILIFTPLNHLDSTKRTTHT